MVNLEAIVDETWQLVEIKRFVLEVRALVVYQMWWTGLILFIVMYNYYRVGTRDCDAEQHADSRVLT